jgi:hypothetical protein
LTAIRQARGNAFEVSTGAVSNAPTFSKTVTNAVSSDTVPPMKAVASKVSPAIYAEVRREADSRGISVSAVVREALERVFGESEGNLNPSVNRSKGGE